MRRSGRTTRIVDEAIQKLFTEGSIQIVTKNTNVKNVVCKILVQDHVNGSRFMANETLYQIIKTRLAFEHSGPEFMEFDGVKLTIKIKK